MARETKKTATKTTTKTTRSSSGKKLVIVESPGKIKSLKKFLGRGFSVKASMGHVRDIPSKGRGREAFGIDFENGYQPTYVPIKGREKTLADLKKAADKADEVFLAPDPDREGEAIAWHLKEALDLPDEKVRRVTFNAITKNAVQEAIDHPGKLDMNLVNAQQGRRVLDRIVGFSLSPFLWKKVTKGLSAGRVQSVAVRLVVEREKEIEAFDPREYWKIVAELSREGERFDALLVEWEGQSLTLADIDDETAKAMREDLKKTDGFTNSEAVAKEVAAALEKAEYVVEKVEEKESTSRPKPPFITSTLQQAASTFLGFNTARTMRVAQQLYEGIEVEGSHTGLITYMRTDSTRISPEGLGDARGYIGEHYDPEYLPEKAHVYSSKKGAQDAHEAIRPSTVGYTPDRIKPFLSEEQFKLYDLIWRRFVASQMTPARYHNTTVHIRAAAGRLDARGRRVLFPGHTVLGLEFRRKSQKKVEAKDEKDEAEETKSEDKDQFLPPLAVDDVLQKHDLRLSQHFTQPPPRYSEASLVRALEREGIGRPSTYAPIIKTIQDRGYVVQHRRRFHATELGRAVTDILMRNFDKIMDIHFTAKMEQDLDDVEEGEVDWVKLIDNFYQPFARELEEASEHAQPLKGRPAPGGEKCPQCGADMIIRYSKSGAFLGCVNYPDCKGLLPMPGEEKDDEDGEEEEAPQCPRCGEATIKKRSRFGEFYACTQYPDCKQTVPIGKDGKAAKLPEIHKDCPTCNIRMNVKSGRSGLSLTCPECKYIEYLDKDGNVIELPKVEGVTCEKCAAEMVVRMSRRGPFLACSAFPKCRSTKPLPKEGEENGEEKPKKKTARKKTARKKTARKTAKKSPKKKTDDAEPAGEDEAPF